MSVSRRTDLPEQEAQRASKRLHTAFALHESGVAIKRAQLRRDDPAADDLTIARRVAAWLRERPDAPFGDAEGVGKTHAD